MAKGNRCHVGLQRRRHERWTPFIRPTRSGFSTFNANSTRGVGPIPMMRGGTCGAGLPTHRNLRLAWRRVASNRGARSSGVDKVTVKHIETRIGVERFLTKTRTALRNGSYRPQPVRRVMIPKRGKPGLFRPLGVPTVQDRVVQAALLQLLEPIFEAEFLTVSYGFRPKRACRDALEHIRNAIRHGR
jgi:Reverse transcriptase (RNA-dependent DNA polymerase)